MLFVFILLGIIQAFYLVQYLLLEMPPLPFQNIILGKRLADLCPG
jgi:hypothetical protein